MPNDSVIEATETMKTQQIKSLGVFLLLLAVFSGVAYYFTIEHGLRRYYVAFLMWCPGLAALATCKLRKIDVGELGWRWPAGKWLALSYFLPVLYGLIAYGILWGGGFGGLLDNRFVKEVSYFLVLEGWSETAVILFGILMFGTVGMIWHVATALGEEIGWRGFLAAKLMDVAAFPVAALVTGVIWGLWHAPIIFYTKFNAGPLNLEVQFLNYMVLTIGLSFIMQYLRVRSASVWPAVVLHASHNIYLMTIMQPMTIQYDETWRYASEFGFFLPFTVLAFGLYFWWRARQEGISGTGVQSAE